MLGDKVAKNVKKFRELKGYTREEMASFLEMSASGYAKIEQGSVDIGVKRLAQIGAVLEINPKHILDFEVNKVFNDSNIDFTHSLTETRKEANNTKTTYQSNYLQKLVDSLERENKLLRERLEGKEPKA